MFHQSGGESSSPRCFTKGEFRVSANGVRLSQTHGYDSFMSASQFAYWQHTQRTANAVKGRGASFSLEIMLSVQLLSRSRLFTKAEERDVPLGLDREAYPP